MPTPPPGPEITIADQIIRLIPRAGDIPLQSLLYGVSRSFQGSEDSFNKYFPIALQNLMHEGYMTGHVIKVGSDSFSTQYELTQAGRVLQDSGGYLKAYNKKREKDSFGERVNKAEGKKKLFDNRVKVIAFLILIVGGYVTLKGLFGKNEKDQEYKQGAQHQLDSIKKPIPQVNTNTAPAKKRHPNTENSTHLTASTTHSMPNQPAQKQANDFINNYVAPLGKANSDNIEFVLTAAVGSKHAQTVTLTVILTTTAANWYIMSSVKSIIDNEGNEYRIKSFTIGANNYFPQVNLVTEVPIKCTYTFGGILPNVRSIKLFKFDYTHKLGEPYYVEFRDIPIEWK